MAEKLVDMRRVLGERSAYAHLRFPHGSFQRRQRRLRIAVEPSQHASGATVAHAATVDGARSRQVQRRDARQREKAARASAQNRRRTACRTPEPRAVNRTMRSGWTRMLSGTIPLGCFFWGFCPAAFRGGRAAAAQVEASRRERFAAGGGTNVASDLLYASLLSTEIASTENRDPEDYDLVAIIFSSETHARPPCLLR